MLGIVLLISVIIILVVYYTMFAEYTIEDIARNEARRYNPVSLPDGKTIIEIRITDGVPVIAKGTDDEAFKERQGVVFEFIKGVLQKYNSRVTRTLIVGLHDVRDEYMGILVFSKYKKSENNTLIPDAYAMGNYEGLLGEDRKDKIPINQKTNSAIFVGSSTGSTDPAHNERLKFSEWAIEKNYVDSYITSIVQIDEFKISQTYPRYKEFMREYMKEEAQMKYLYIISIDGNAPAWNRVPWILNSNSVLLMKRSPKVNWYYGLMKEGEHYLGFDDPEEIHEYIDTLNISELEKITENAQKFVREVISFDKQQYYMMKIIEFISHPSAS